MGNFCDSKIVNCSFIYLKTYLIPQAKVPLPYDCYQILLTDANNDNDNEPFHKFESVPEQNIKFADLQALSFFITWLKYSNTAKGSVSELHYCN